MPKNNSIKLVAVLLVFLLSIIFSLFAKGGGGQDKEVVMTVREYLVNSFVSELPEINRNLPHKIDNKTTLLSIEYLDGKVVSKYRLDDIGYDVNLANNFNIQLKSIIKKQTCTDKVKSSLLEVDVDFVEKYQDPKGAAIFEVAVSKFDCLMLDVEK